MKLRKLPLLLKFHKLLKHVVHASTKLTVL